MWKRKHRYPIRVKSFEIVVNRNFGPQRMGVAMPFVKGSRVWRLVACDEPEKVLARAFPRYGRLILDSQVTLEKGKRYRWEEENEKEAFDG